MQQRVSVIIPCYEHTEYLGEALESAVSQGANVETIVVDDGSRCDVRAVTRRFPSVRYIRQVHRGVSAARNTGLAAQDAPWVLFLDADDRLLPGAIDAHLRSHNQHPGAGFVFGTFQFITQSGSFAGLPEVYIPIAPDYLSLIRFNYIGMLGTVLFRTEAVNEAGGFDYTLTLSEDYELLLKIARVRSIYFHGEPSAEYRRYDSSASADDSRMLTAVVSVLERERTRADPVLAHDPAFDEGEEFFKLFYGVRMIRQLMREVVLHGHFSKAAELFLKLRDSLGLRLLILKLPPAVAVAAVRKAWQICGRWRYRKLPMSPT